MDPRHKTAGSKNGGFPEDPCHADNGRSGCAFATLWASPVLPFGHWRTQTFVGALRPSRRYDVSTAGQRMTGWMFGRYIATQLAPARKGDVVILDNLSSHKSPSAARAMHAVGAWFLCLPPYSPDLDPIEMACAKRKTLFRKAAARTYDQLWHAGGNVCDLFTDNERYNSFKAAGYKSD